jgi:hypothetical protein
VQCTFTIGDNVLLTRVGESHCSTHVFLTELCLFVIDSFNMLTPLIIVMQVNDELQCIFIMPYRTAI